MIYTMTFNPSLDYIATVEDFKEGTTNRTSEEMLFPGGKGINVSIVLHHLGCENRALGFMAGFTGREIERMLSAMGIPSDFIEVDEGIARINIKLRNRRGDAADVIETEVNGAGPKIAEEDIGRLYRQLDSLQKGDYLVLAGSIPQTLPDSIYHDIMKYLAGRDIRIVVDATKDLLLKVLPEHPFLIKPNHNELSEIFGVSCQSVEDCIPYAKKLREMGADNVLVSLAEKGALLVSAAGEVYSAPAPKGRLINSVGAGDSMVAGFLSGFLRAGDYEEAFYTGLCAGSASAFSETLADAAAVRALLARTGRCYAV